jgi:hypothetical protein
MAPYVSEADTVLLYSLIVHGTEVCMHYISLINVKLCLFILFYLSMLQCLHRRH